MPQDDFNLAELADYLHLNLAVVAKMAERGKVPGRKIGGEWRFVQAEIHHWLEDRIGGTADVEELEQLEAALQRDLEKKGLDDVHLEDWLPPEAVQVPLDGRTKNSVIRAMMDLAVRTGYLWDAEKMEAAIRQREDLHPTALDCGAALLHPRRPLSSILGQAFLAFGRTTNGIPFGGERGRLTDLFFLVCSVDDRSHLRLIARLSRLLSQPGFLDELRHREDSESSRAWILECDGKLTDAG